MTTLIGVNLGRRGYRYPLWQVGLSGLDEVLAAMREYGPWSQWGFMLSYNAVLENETPLAALRRGDVARVFSPHSPGSISGKTIDDAPHCGSSTVDLVQT